MDIIIHVFRIFSNYLFSGLFSSFEEFGSYRVSSLEKSYVWQPNFEKNDLGYNLLRVFTAIDFH